VTFLTVLHGWPDDAARWLDSIERHHAGLDHEVLLVDNSGNPEVAAWVAEREADSVRSLAFPEPAGWATAVNAGLAAAAGEVVILFDPGTEAQGDVAGPLLAALEQPAVGLAGAFGVRAVDKVGHFHESEGPEVDALEGYCIAMGRADALGLGGFDEKYRFYRIADFEFSFRVRNTGRKAIVVPGLPLRKHAHRLWEAIPEAERDAVSKKNFYRFLGRWGKRNDLLVGE